MQHMFSTSPWFNTQRGGVPGLGFTPGPVQIRLVGAPAMSPAFIQGGPVSPPQAAPVQAPAPGAAPPAPPGAVPMGRKADCPVCRSFGGGF